VLALTAANGRRRVEGEARPGIDIVERCGIPIRWIIVYCDLRNLWQWTSLRSGPPNLARVSHRVVVERFVVACLKVGNGQRRYASTVAREGRMAMLGGTGTFP